MRKTALAAITFLVAASAIASFSESYRALYDWAHGHGLFGLWAIIWPLQVDVFIAVGEIALFVALADQWTFRSRVGAWVVTGLGLVVSVAGNVGHVQSGAWTSRGTAAVPPLAAAAALAVGLGVLKRVVAATNAIRMADVSEPADSMIANDYTVIANDLDTEPEPELPEPNFYPSDGPRYADTEPVEVQPSSNGHRIPPRGQEAATRYAAQLRRGEVPTVRQIRSDMHVGQERSMSIRRYLAVLTAEVNA